MADGLIWANSRIKMREQKLLTTERLQRLIDCSTFSDAVKTLAEYGYGDGTATDSDAIISADRKELFALLDELELKDTRLMRIVLSRFDFHNVKALMKAKYARITDCSAMLYSGVYYDEAQLKASIDSDDYSMLCKELKVALERIDESFAGGKRSPRLIDVLVDKAYFEYAARLASGNEFYTSFIEEKAFNTNLLIFLRSKKLGADKEEFESQLVGKPDKFTRLMLDMYEQGADGLLNKLEFTDLAEIVLAVKDVDLTVAERYLDNRIINMFKARKGDIDGDVAAAGYFLAREQDENAIGLILTAIKNGIDRQVVKDRLRACYGG